MIKEALANRLIFLLSLVGLGICVFLWYEYTQTGPILCPTGQGCDVVRASSYSSFLGISIPVLGVVYYFSIAAASFLRSAQPHNLRLWRFQLFAALAAFAFGVYLTALEGLVIGAYCFWCVSSFIISGAILVLVVLPKIKKHDQ